MMEEADLDLFVDQCETRLRTFKKRSKLQWMRDLSVAVRELGLMFLTVRETVKANEQLARERNGLMRERAREDEAGFEAGVDAVREVRDRLGTLEQHMKLIADAGDGATVEGLRILARAALDRAKECDRGQQ